MLDEAWSLAPSVALRPEPFGALAYHFGNRKLVFLKHPDLVAVVRALGTQGTQDAQGAHGVSVRAALEAAGVPEASWAAYVKALEGLAASDMIRRVAA